MPIASFGSKVFEVSSNKIYTFDGLSRKVALSIEDQEKEYNKPSTYIKGFALDDLSFSLMLDTRFVDVDAEYIEWIRICNNKTPYFFILGGQPIGNNKFLLVDVSEADTRFSNSGSRIKTTLSLNFKEYVRQGFKQETEAEKKKKKKENKIDYTEYIDKIMAEDKKRQNSQADKSIANGVKG